MTFLQTSETAVLTLLSNACETEISDKVLFRNVTGSNLSQQFTTGARIKLCCLNPRGKGNNTTAYFKRRKEQIHSIVACLLIPLSPACIAHNENKAPSQGNNREYIFSPPLDMIASLGEPRPHIRLAY